MPATEETSKAGPGFAHYLGLAARGGAVAVAFLYSIGFALLCVYDARYGVFEFDFLRARIFFVGFTFALLCTLAAAAKHYGFSYYEPLKALLRDNSPEHRLQREIVLSAGFVFTAFLIASAFGYFIFAPDSAIKISGRLVALEVVSGVIGIAAFMCTYWYIGKTFAQHPNRAVVLALFASGVFVGCLYASRNTSTANLTLFFIGVALAVDVARRDRAGGAKYLLHFENWRFAVLWLAFYAAFVFKTIQPRYGGGAPEPVIIYLQRPAAWFTAGRINVSLLDETDRGLYVLPSPKANALLIPQDSVAAIYFGSANDLPSEPENRNK